MKLLKTLWLTLSYPALYLGTQVIISGAYALAASFWHVVSGMLRDPDAFRGDPQALQEGIVKSLDLQIPMVIACAIVLLTIYLINRRKWQSEGFLRLPPGKGAYLPYAAAVGILSSAALSLLMSLFDATSYFPEYEEIMDIAMGGNAALRTFVIVIVAPLTEELVFRGLVMGHLSERMKLPFAALISSVVFGIAHLNVLQGVYAAIIGLVFALIYIRSGTIWASVLAHIGFNSVSSIATLLLDAPVLAGFVFILMYLGSVICIVLFHLRGRSRVSP